MEHGLCLIRRQSPSRFIEPFTPYDCFEENALRSMVGGKSRGLAADGGARMSRADGASPMLDWGERGATQLILDDGAVCLFGFAIDVADELIEAIAQIAARAPFRQMQTPGGKSMSAAMTNCGQSGWVSDRRGYRYAAADPDTGKRWPEMPQAFQDVANRAASAGGYPLFQPDVALINRYEIDARMSLHQDRDEQDFTQPIVSVSLGLPAVFLWGGLTRSAKPRRIELRHGDVVVWGGRSRLHFHGIQPIAANEHELTGRVRYNLTFRRAGPALQLR
jgi:alkylated DNA repair protein (DNA oxidative demethylase)